METQASIRSAICQGEWAVSVDIRDAYLHVPMSRDVRRYLRLKVNRHVYQFTSSLRFGNFSSGVHQVAAASCDPSAVKRDPTACVFGRLAHSSFVTSTGSIACKFSHQGSPAPGLDHQLRQVRTPAQSNLRLHWHAVQHTHTHRGAPTQDASQSQQHAGSLEVLALGHSLGPSQTLGDPKYYGNSDAKGQDAPPSHSVVGQRGLVPGGALVGLGSGHPLSTLSGGLVGVPGCTPGRSTEYAGVGSWHSTQTPHVMDGVHSLARALSTGLGRRPSANATSVC